MIYATKERAQEIARMLNEQRGYQPCVAALTVYGWTVIERSPYSQNSVIAYAED